MLKGIKNQLLERVTKDDYINWKSSDLTKALISQLRSDQIEIMENWLFGKYNPEQALHAQGAGKYIEEIIEGIIPDMNPEEWEKLND